MLGNNTSQLQAARSPSPWVLRHKPTSEQLKLSWNSNWRTISAKAACHCQDSWARQHRWTVSQPSRRILYTERWDPCIQHKYPGSPLQLEKTWAYTATSVWPLKPETATSPAGRLELRPIISSGSATLSGCSVPETQVAPVDQIVPGGNHWSRSVRVWLRSVCNR